ncbi:hypothetical protein LUZ60_005811 [Juncus effusus]|nr:hypothetical protein LUZ60_005811 [Juncus effusus]
MVRGTRLRVCFSAVLCVILVWACVWQLVSFDWLWCCSRDANALREGSALDSTIFRNGVLSGLNESPVDLPSPRIYRSNGYLKVSCNGGLNQMRSEICDMVAIARLLNLTLVLPELDKRSFWADPSNFGDIFDVKHFIDSLRDEVRIIKKLPKRFSDINSSHILKMSPISWSDEKYYVNQILPLFNKYKVIHFNKTDARLANNGINSTIQKLRCKVNFHALKFTREIEELGEKLVRLIRKRWKFVALHLRYEMDMLAFSGCNHGCSNKEAEDLKKMRYAYPWWREKEIDSETKRSQGLCPLTPEESSLILKALGFDNHTLIYIAAGETFGGENRIKTLRNSFPYIVKKEMLVEPELLRKFQNHSSQMAAIDFIISVASDVFIPTYDGNMAKLVEGHRRYKGYKKSILLDRRKLVGFLDLYENKTISWDQFAKDVRETHKSNIGQESCRKVVSNKPKEEDYFYSNPYECLVNSNECMIS